MELKDKKKWNDYVAENTNPYGLTIIKVARKTMELLDRNPEPLVNGYDPDSHSAYGLICKADDDSRFELTGFMVKCVVDIISECHKRGDEFIKSFNSF